MSAEDGGDRQDGATTYGHKIQGHRGDKLPDGEK